MKEAGAQGTCHKADEKQLTDQAQGLSGILF